MLVIRRRAGEIFSIGADIRIEILEISATQVKLGITAPRDVLILRREIEITREQNESAALAIAPQRLDHPAVRLRERDQPKPAPPRV